MPGFLKAGAHVQAAVQTAHMALELRFVGEEKDMTFDELAKFVEQARSNGVDGTRNIYAELSTSGKVKVLIVSLGGDD
jgi:hypothetical protein